MPRPLRHIGSAVFAALTDDEKAELARRLRIARASYHGGQSDDWLCCMLQLYIDPRGLSRGDEVTRADMLGTCVDLACLIGRDSWYRVLGVFGRYRDRVAGLYIDALTSDGTEPDYEAIGQRVYAGLTPEDRKHMKSALRVVRHDPDGDDDWHCALGNRGHGNLIEEGTRVTNEHVLEMCVLLAELHDVVRDDPRLDETDWERLINGGFGSRHEDRIKALYADAQMPLFEDLDLID